MPNRPAFTLVEVLVALLLFEFAMLALTGAAAIAARDLATARTMRQATGIARNRVERIASTPCPAPGSFTAVPAPTLVEHWRIEAVGAARLISDSVVVVGSRPRSPAAVARAVALCEP